jgi:hypothetical protein
MLDVCDYEERDVVGELVSWKYLGEEEEEFKKGSPRLYQKPGS